MLVYGCHPAEILFVHRSKSHPDVVGEVLKKYLAQKCTVEACTTSNKSLHVPQQLGRCAVAEVCSGRASGQYRYDQKYMSGVFTNSTHALTLETEQSIKAKLCAIKAKYLNIAFGISVYDIDADMEDKSCAQVEYTGRYKRLKLLKRIRDFLKGYTAKNMKQACENL
ncbi:uncharacterized protein LOC119382129 [Rhipicephalus sanguineus]|uniref:uncharacterized protein LOC119382129 n=1 Tax=Rhipicephalus sanguineus TaxID=34632 RepID=UPI0018939CB6|nr:uncharacterized protein LOC119382129 [Rhipicephalus sanguineus]